MFVKAIKKLLVPTLFSCMNHCCRFGCSTVWAEIIKTLKSNIHISMYRAYSFQKWVVSIVVSFTKVEFIKIWTHICTFFLQYTWVVSALLLLITFSYQPVWIISLNNSLNKKNQDTHLEFMLRWEILSFNTSLLFCICWAIGGQFYSKRDIFKSKYTATSRGFRPEFSYDFWCKWMWFVHSLCFVW